MTARRALVAGVAAAIVVAAWLAAHRRAPASPPTATAAAPAGPGYLAPAGPAPTLAVDVTADAVVTDQAPAGPPTPTEAAAFASSLADAQCACRDGACLDAVNRRFAAGVGVVQPGGDPRAMHDAYARGAACAAAVRVAAPAP